MICLPVNAQAWEFAKGHEKGLLAEQRNVMYSTMNNHGLPISSFVIDRKFLDVIHVEAFSILGFAI